jgi:glycine hydroxymethyltransferase
MAHRYTSPGQFYMGTHFIDELEDYGELVARRLFKADVADLRPLSGHIADLIFLASFGKRGDTLMCVSDPDGGYPGIWELGLPSILGIEIGGLPFSRSKMNIDVENSVAAIVRIKPKIVLLGASLFLFPHPVQEIAKAAKDVGACLGYDGSHVLGLVGGGRFQSPLQEGASVLFGSTHKTFFGPQGGLMLADFEHGEALKERIHPTFVDNAHWNRIAALTLALAEIETFGKAYAGQVIKNAQALARCLDDCGLPVFGSELGYTKSHQVLLDYGGYKQGRKAARRLERANIIADCGVRLGTCEVTRRGMKENEMEQIAELIRHVIIDRQDGEKTRREVERLAAAFDEVQYAFPQPKR